jgi:tetratricopeptide (TPR) repeat protein
MNLEELQIKIGIELKELNKQLKKASDDINEYLGPKATKKMMADNNKVIKDGFKIMEKTTKTSAKQINKDLNDAFDIDKTLVKFNKSIDRSMEQAKRSVRSACNDIRRELNAALNVNANIRVSASASTTQRQSFGSRANTAAMVSSNQYTAAMMVKAINGMISAENKNTGRLEGAINKSTNKLVSAISKQQNKNFKIENKVEVKAPEVKVNVPEVKVPEITVNMPETETKAPEVTIEIPEIKVPDIEIDLSQINESINKLGDKLASAISSLEDVIRSNNNQDKPVKVESVNKPVITKEQGQQQTASTSNLKPSVFNPPKQQPKVFRTSPSADDDYTRKVARKAIDDTYFDDIDKVFQSIIETISVLSTPLNPKKVISSIASQIALESIAENIKVSPGQQNSLIYGDIAKLEAQKEQLKNKRDGIIGGNGVDISKINTSLYKDIFDKEIEQIDKAISELRKSLNPIDLKSPEAPNATSPEQLEEMLNRSKKSIEAFNKAIEEQTKAAQEQLRKIQEQIRKSQENFTKNNPINKPNTTTATINKPTSTTGIAQEPDATGGSEKDDRVARVLAKYKKIAEEVESELKDIVKGLNEMEGEPDTDELDKYYEALMKIREQVGKIMMAPDPSKIKNDGIRKVVTDLQHYKDIIKDLERHIGTLKFVNGGTSLSKGSKGLLNATQLANIEKRLNDPNKPNISNRNNNSLGFLPYKQQLNDLAETAKKVGAKIKKALSTAFHPIAGPDKLDSVLTRIEKKAISVFNKIKSVLSKIFTPLVNVFSKIVGPIINVFSKVVVFAKSMGHKIANAFRIGMYKAAALVRNYGFVIKTHLNKIFTGIKSTKLYTSIASGLNKAKSAVSKFASKVRPILNKAFDGIKSTKLYKNITKGLDKALEKAKKSLSKFVSNCKKIVMKLPAIFAKSVKASLSAIGKLATGLKSLLGKMLKAVSAFAIAGVALIAKSQTLAQSEAKLTVLMKQRMGATKETVKAIRELAEEQANLGVVSESAMVRGAEQLSRYVSSAKALKELMPAIANMTALRGGFNATPEDAEEIATQLGEAIREGTTTPLEQSGIYLSEAEIKKFQALRTEEERAAYLADVIAKNVGNLNEQLANTPHGAIAQLKNNFMSLLGTLGTLLVNVIQPIVKWLNTIVVAANNALKALGELLGFDMTGGGLAGLGDVGTGSAGTGTSGVDNVTDSYNDAADAADAATEANEKFKGSLMGFDEINTLSDNTNKDSGSGGSEELDPTDISAIGGQLIPTEITEGENIFEKFGEKMKAFMDEIIEPFKNAWALLGDRWKEEWKDLIDSFKNFCDSLASFLKSVWDHGGKEFVQHMAEIGLACGIAAMEIGGEILDSLARLWDHLDPSKNMNTQGFLNALNEVSVKVRDFVLGLGDHFESLMANGGQDVLNSLGDMCMNFGEAATRGFGVAIDALDGLIDHLDPANNDFTKDMLKAWEEAFDSVGQCALDFAGLLESTLVNGGQEIINSLGDLGMKIGEAFGVLVDECAETLSELFKHMDPATNPHSKKMLESIDGLIDSVTGFVDACIDAFKRFMDNGGREFVKNLGDILAIVIDLAAELGSGIIDVITAFMDSWVGQTLIEGVAQALKWVTDKLLGLSDAFDVVKDIFGNIIDIIVGIFEGDGEKVGRAFANLIKNAFKLTGELLQWLFDLGLDLIKGLIKGICALPGLLWDAVKFIFDTIVGFFKELFGIHSPSTVFAELGGFLIEGLVNGITGAIKLVTDAFKKIGETILNAAKDVIKTVSEKFKDMKDTIKEKLNEAKEVVSEKWKDMKETVSEKAKEIYNITKEKWSEVKQTISEKAKESYQVAKENWDNIKQTVSEKTKEAYSSIKENWANIKQTAVDIFTGTYETTRDKWTNIKDVVADKTKSAYESARDKWADIKQVTTDRFKESYETIKDKFTNIKDTVKDKATQTYEDVSDAWTKIKDDAGKKLEQIKTDAESRYKDVKDVMVNKVNEAKEGIVAKWEEVRTKTNECIENVKTTAENSYNNVKETIAKKLDEVKSNTSSKWEEIKKNTSESVENIRKEAEERYGKIKESLTNTLEQTKNNMSTKWNNIKTDAISKATEIANNATTKFAEIKTKFSSKMDEVKSTLSSKWDSLKTQASTNASDIVSKAKSGLSNMGQNMADAITSGKSKVSSALNEIGKLINGVKWKFPEIKLPKLPKIKIEWKELAGNSWFSAIKYPTLSWNARGGIIDGITPLGFANGALQMGGEAGKEMVVPLENTSFTTKIAQAMGQAVDNAMARNYKNMSNNNNNSFNDNRDVVLQLDGREFARASINSINKLQRESGRTLLDV